MVKTPGAPSKTSKRGSQLLKNILGTTAPNSPTDDGNDDDEEEDEDDIMNLEGVTVMANEYDPFQDLESLVSGNFPPSPLRDASLISSRSINHDNTSTIKTPVTYGGCSLRSSTTQEEKKEDEEGLERGTSKKSSSSTVGVDVVGKTLAIFDKLCAAPPEPTTTHHFTASSIASYSVGSANKGTKKEAFRDDGRKATISPSSFRTGSGGPYANSTTPVVKKETKSKKRTISRSPSHDHENFEVVLDPSSYQSDDDDDVDQVARIANALALKQRRWPFVGNQQHSKQHHPKQQHHQKQLYQDTNPVPNKPLLPPIMPSPLAEEEMTQATFASLIPDVNLSITEDQPTQQFNEGADSAQQETKEIMVDEMVIIKKKSDTKKSIVGRSWKSCKKLIAKAGGVGGTITRELKHQHHRAEVDDEAKHTRSLEMQKERLEETIQAGSDNVEQPVQEEELKQGGTKEAKRMLSSTSDVWSSIVASLAVTFDPEVAVASNSAPTDDPKTASVPKEDKQTLEQAKKNEAKRELVNSPLEPKTQPAFYRRGQGKPKSSASAGWNKLRSTKKTAKNFVPTVKRETPSHKASVTKTVPQPPKAVPVTRESLPNSLEKSSEALPLEKPKAVWKGVTDKDTGKTYYYHRQTRETTWTKPKDYEKFEADLKKWKAATALQNLTKSSPHNINSNNNDLINLNSVPEKKSPPPTPQVKSESLPTDRSSSPRVASWPLTNQKSDEDEEGGFLKRTVTPPAKQDNTVVLTIADPITAQSKQTRTDEDKTVAKNWEKWNEVERLLKSLPPNDSRPSLDKLMQDFAGREGVLLKELRAKVEALPLDETQPFDEPMSMEARKRSLQSSKASSPVRLNQRAMTYVSKASATTRSSALTDRTEKIKNTGKGRLTPFVPIAEQLNPALTSSLNTRIEDRYRCTTPPVAGRIPSRVPVPRERQLMVEELTDCRISAESYEGTGGKRGRIVRGRPREHIAARQLDTIYDGDNDTDGDNTTSFDNDTYCTDSVSALSENDTDFLHRKDNFEQARRRALDDAIEREDWDLAAALSEGMRAANLPGGYARAHSSWNQSELDKFIANNDWSAVKRYIARMREKSQASTNKSIGARSQLQHKELMSQSSWTTSDSQSSYESYDSESEV
jgi:hypothetical protein